MLPTWLITTTVLTGEEIRYTVADLCVPGTERPESGLAEAWPEILTGEPAWTSTWHPARARQPRMPRPAREDSRRIRSMPMYYPARLHCSRFRFNAGLSSLLEPPSQVRSEER